MGGSLEFMVLLDLLFMPMVHENVLHDTLSFNISKPLIYFGIFGENKLDCIERQRPHTI